MATILGNFFRKLFGTGMTDREKEASEMNMREAEKQRMWEEQMYDRYQSPRAMMNQYKDAGLNPSLVAGGSMPSPSFGGATGHTDTDSSGSDLLSLVSTVAGLSRTASEIGLQKSQARLNDASAERTKAETAGQNITNSWLDIRNRLETEEARSRVDSNLQSIRESVSRVSLNEAHELRIGSEILNIDSQTELNEVRTMVNNLTAEKMRVELTHVDALLSAQQALYTAQTSTEVAKQAELYQQAALTMAESMKENRLISNGYYEALTNDLRAQINHVRTMTNGEQVRNEMLSKDAKWQTANNWINATTNVLRGVGSVATGFGAVSGGIKAISSMK